MRNVLVRLQREAKVRADVSHPSRCRFFGEAAAEGVVHFDGGELRRVELTEILLTHIMGIEARLPDGVGPAGSANVKWKIGKLSTSLLGSWSGSYRLRF